LSDTPRRGDEFTLRKEKKGRKKKEDRHSNFTTLSYLPIHLPAGTEKRKGRKERIEKGKRRIKGHPDGSPGI